MNLELMKAGYPPTDIKFADRISYYNAFDEYYVKYNPGAMEKLFTGLCEYMAVQHKTRCLHYLNENARDYS